MKIRVRSKMFLERIVVFSVSRLEECCSRIELMANQIACLNLSTVKVKDNVV